MSHTPFQDARRAASAWIAGELCTPRGWAAPPPGLPLCRMRLTPAQRASLGGVLRRHLRTAGLNPRGLAALFCLFAAEVLRDRPGGEMWSWNMVAEAWPFHRGRLGSGSTSPKGRSWAERQLVSR